MTKRDGFFWFRLVVLALAVVAMVLSIIAATERSYGELVSALRSKGLRVTEAWK